MKADEAQSEHVPFMYLLVMPLICCEISQLILHFTDTNIDSVSVEKDLYVKDGLTFAIAVHLVHLSV